MTKALFAWHDKGGKIQHEIRDVTLGKLVDGQALVQNNFIAATYNDMLRIGSNPAIPGCAASGVIEEISSKTKELKVGDRVLYGAALSGTYSEKNIVPVKHLIKNSFFYPSRHGSRINFPRYDRTCIY